MGRSCFDLSLLTDARDLKERVFVLTFTALMLLVPPLVIDFYPFSVFPMFSDAPRTRVQIRARDGKGAPIELGQVGIWYQYAANHSPRFNAKLQRPLEAAYRFWRPEEFVPLVQEKIRDHAVVAPVQIEQDLIAPVEHGEHPTVGITAKQIWTISVDQFEMVETSGNAP